MSVDKDGRLIRPGAQPLAIGHGVARRRHHLDILQVELTHMRDQPFGHALDITGIGRVAAEAGDVQHLE